MINASGAEELSRGFSIAKLISSAFFTTDSDKVNGTKPSVRNVLCDLAVYGLRATSGELYQASQPFGRAGSQNCLAIEVNRRYL